MTKKKKRKMAKLRILVVSLLVVVLGFAAYSGSSFGKGPVTGAILSLEENQAQIETNYANLSKELIENATSKLELTRTILKEAVLGSESALMNVNNAEKYRNIAQGFLDNKEYLSAYGNALQAIRNVDKALLEVDSSGRWQEIYSKRDEARRSTEKDEPSNNTELMAEEPEVLVAGEEKQGFLSKLLGFFNKFR